MSLRRLIYYSMVIGGWAAFLGWAIAEITNWIAEFEQAGYLQLMLFSVLVGGAIGAGLIVVAGLTNPQWKRLAPRVLLGLVCGGASGLVGGLVGNTLFVSVSGLMRVVGIPEGLADVIGAVFLVFGWTLLGLSVGAVDGLLDRAWRRAKIGFWGGAIGGALGGILFVLITSLVATEMSSRATGFVVLGMCIGFAVGLMQNVRKEAWVRVLSGYRPGREIILDRPVEVFGRGELLRLPFRGAENSALNQEHFSIVRQEGGGFAVEFEGNTVPVQVGSDKGSFEDVSGLRVLRDGDIIKFGENSIRFYERQQAAAGRSADDAPKPSKSSTDSAPAPRPKAPPPPPPPPPASPGPKKQEAPEAETTESQSSKEAESSASKDAGSPKTPAPPPPPPPPPPPAG